MTYTFNTLNASSAGKSPLRSGVVRFGQELVLLVALLLQLLWFLALVSYSAQDPAWSTSGTLQGTMVANWMGRLGAWVADGSYFLFGFSIWWVVIAAAMAWVGALQRWMRADRTTRERIWPQRLLFWAGLWLLLLSSCALEWSRMYRFESFLPGHAGGILGYMLGRAAMQWLGFAGSGLLGIVCVVLGVALVFRFSWGAVAEGLGERLEALLFFGRAQREKLMDQAVGKRAARQREQVLQEERDFHHSRPVTIIDPVLADPLPMHAPAAAAQRGTASHAPNQEAPDKDKATLPSVDLLDKAPAQQESVATETLEMTSRLIEKKLKDFGVEVSVVAAQAGPVITRYEIDPATGVKGSQVMGLAKDLARSLSLVSVRVVETIPGKATMALELPNARRQTIRLSEILGSQVYLEAQSLLTVGLGKDIIGKPVVADLAKMPHCLVAGTTGSGKSVGINAMILSLLYKADARDVRLMMIDPKMLEMSVYEGIPHLLCPVVTDMKQAANGLNWCVGEMDRRYQLMSKLGVRNLAGYNARLHEMQAHRAPPMSEEPLDKLPHIVVIIDELADLMMVMGKKVEELIVRLAQKARAAGIHLVLATQRPSVDVITGLIKANIPTRIAFSVGSKIDSRTILDQMGAEALLGMGDMLYMASGTGLPVRVHGAFVSDEEVHRVVRYLKAQGGANYIDGVLDSVGGEDSAHSNGEKDPLYDQAVEMVLKERKPNSTYLQRKLGIGYNRAANLLEHMEQAGLVSTVTASGKREVLMPARSE